MSDMMREYDGGLRRKRCPECDTLLEEDHEGNLTVCPECSQEDDDLPGPEDGLPGPEDGLPEPEDVLKD